MKDYIKPTVRELDSEHVILHVGTNNLNSSLPPEEIADSIIDLAKSMKTDNRNITISTIISRGDKLNNKANEVNNFLIQLYRDCNIPFIDHSKNINPHKHLNRSKSHFNVTGNRTFVDNIKRFLIKYYCHADQRSNINGLLNSCSVLTESSENELINSDPNYVIRKNYSSAESVAFLEKLRLENPNRLIFGHLNINSIRSKFEMLTNISQRKLNILLVSETKIDVSFPSGQLVILGFAPPYRFDRNSKGGVCFCI